MSSIMRRRRGLISAIGNSCLMRWFTKPTLSDRRPRRQPLPTAKRFRSIRNRYSTVGVGLDWTLIPGPVSALIDTPIATTRSHCCHKQLLRLRAEAHHSCAQSSNIGVHVWTATPGIVRGRKSQAYLVVNHVWRLIDLDMHGSPQGDTQCRAVCRDRLIFRHKAHPSLELKHRRCQSSHTRSKKRERGENIL